MEIWWLPCAAEGYLCGTISGDLSGKEASEDLKMQLIFLSFLPGSLQRAHRKVGKTRKKFRRWSAAMEGP